MTSRRASVYVAAWSLPLTSTVCALPGVSAHSTHPLVLALRSQIFLPSASTTENRAATPPDVAISWKTSASVCSPSGTLRQREKTPPPVPNVARAPSSAKLPLGSSAQPSGVSVRTRSSAYAPVVPESARTSRR